MGVVLVIPGHQQRLDDEAIGCQAELPFMWLTFTAGIRWGDRHGAAAGRRRLVMGITRPSAHKGAPDRVRLRGSQFPIRA